MKKGDSFACECNGTGGNPPADISWYKDNTQIVTGKEKAILVLSNVDKDDSGTYRSEANSTENKNNKTSIELFVIRKCIIELFKKHHRNVFKRHICPCITNLMGMT